MQTYTHLVFGLSLTLAAAFMMSGLSGDVSAQDTPQEEKDKYADFEARVFAEGEGVDLPYRLLVPENAECPMPVLVFLHGAGERGDDNHRQLVHGTDFLRTAASEFNCIVIAPQCPKTKSWAAFERIDGELVLHDELTEPLEKVVALVDSLAEEFEVDTDRLYIMGLSMGGYGSWDAIARYPGKFAAAAPICGGGHPSMAHKMVDTPVWAFHGDDDNVVPVERSREMIQAIKDAGGDPKYTEYPGVNHGSWVPTFAEPGLLPWITSQSLSNEAAQSQPATQPEE
tara:strand:- start:889 stop:1740 length:852 start_codon:yes stop_codon:yes gene_type:complete